MFCFNNGVIIFNRYEEFPDAAELFNNVSPSSTRQEGKEEKKKLLNTMETQTTWISLDTPGSSVAGECSFAVFNVSHLACSCFRVFVVCTAGQSSMIIGMFVSSQQKVIQHISNFHVMVRLSLLLLSTAPPKNPDLNIPKLLMPTSLHL